MGKALVLLTAALLSGCASIIAGTSQTITLNSNPPGAQCSLLREGLVIGSVTTPGGVLVKKTKHDIHIKCKKDGYQDATAVLTSGTEGSTWGNIILGGGIGWAVDSAAGADNKYAEQTTVTLVPETPGAPTLSEKMPPAVPMIEFPAQATYGVHFASYEKADLAQRGWSEIWEKHWQKLSGVKPYVEYRSLEGGQPQYKLYGTGLSKEKAEGLCQSLQEHNKFCAVVNF